MDLIGSKEHPSITWSAPCVSKLLVDSVRKAQEDGCEDVRVSGLLILRRQWGSKEIRTEHDAWVL